MFPKSPSVEHIICKFMDQWCMKVGPYTAKDCRDMKSGQSKNIVLSLCDVLHHVSPDAKHLLALCSWASKVPEA